MLPAGAMEHAGDSLSTEQSLLQNAGVNQTTTTLLQVVGCCACCTGFPAGPTSIDFPAN